MKLLYDHQIFWYQPYGGISNYYYGVMDTAHKNKLFDFEFSTLHANNRYIQGLSYSKAKPFLPQHSFPGKNSLFFALKKKNESNALKILKEGRIDLFHPTYFDTYYAGKTKVPYVLNFFDLTMERFSDMFSPRVTFFKEKKELLKNSRQVIVCSKNTKKDLLKYYDFDAKDVSVAYLSSSLPKKFDAKKVTIDAKNLPKKYILFIGGRDLYKNFNFFAKAIAQLIKDNPEIKIVCAGKELSSTERAYLSTIGILDKVITYSVKDHDLIYLYKNALVMVYPSLYEGFGIPIIEAFDNGCPVALSKASCFPEVAENAAVYFDPANESSIREAVEKIITDDKLKNKIVKLGYARGKEFSLDKTVEQTMKAYEKALS